MARRALPCDADLRIAIEHNLPSTARLLAVYLFGTAAAGTLREDSDVDIAVLSEGALEPVALFDAAQRLATLLGRDVDLVDLGRASTVMRAQVVANGRRLTTTSSLEIDTFEMLALSDYARLAEERRPVVRAMRERYRA